MSALATGGRFPAATVTVNVHWLVLPLLSVAVLVTVVTPIGKADPLAGTLSRLVTVPQRSEAVTLKVTSAVGWPGAAVACMFAGQVIDGGSMSRTVTVNVHWLVLPLASV